MNQEQWQQIKDLFDSVQQDPARRDHLLDEACANDPALRSEILSLLSSQSDSDSFFDTLEGIRERALEDAFGFLRPGDTLVHYRILQKIGEGGMGQVYKAEDLKLKRTVALKVLCSDSAQQEDTRQRLLREARTAATLHHPNVVTVFSIEESNDSDFIVMEYVEGETLKKKLENGPLSLNQLSNLALQVCEALQAAHSIGLIHRDIKPENILLNSQEKVKVVDFGLAKKIVAGEKELTGPGIIAGTVCYMSPEQVNGQPLDQQSDIFSLGSVLYHAATSKLPFEAANLLATMHAINSADPVAPRILRPDLPPEFDRILFHALAKSKGIRYASVQELADDFRTLCEDRLPASYRFILFLEMIDPVLRAAVLGQTEWQKVSGNFHQTTTQKLRDFQGDQVAWDNSGLLARFENSGRAFSCASLLLKAAADLKLPARAALHTGSGNGDELALKTSARICKLGEPGEVLCSNEFRKASHDSAIAFRDRGSHVLEQSKQPVRIFAVAEANTLSREQTAALAGRFKPMNRRMYILATVLVLVLAGLFLMRSPESPPRISSVAVLPFTSASVNPNVQYVSDAITDNLIAQLSQIPGLKVMARGTVFSYKGREVDPRTVGRDLKVDAVVTGSIFQQGEMLIIYADLVRVTDGTVIWGEEYMRKLSELLVLQQEISKRISQQLRLKFDNKTYHEE
ncbi:serine/threonine-protein kinase [bacterium]|nr:serine/threonine-protein kinase [bacterium]